MKLLFWSIAALIFYVYAGYPLLLAAIRACGGRRPVKIADYQPSVTLIVSAYNEASVIGEKIANSLALDYPPDRLEVLVVSDASSDGTDRIVQNAGDPRVKLLRMTDRGGKTVGLNAAAQAAQGEVLVFSDANAMYRPNAIKMLARNLADPQVGAVVGESTYSELESAADEKESLYWRYEVIIKRLESELGSTVGGDGAIYAIRKSLYRPMRPDALSDFVNPLQIVQSGARCIYEPQAVCVEKAAGDFEREFRRKVRIVNRAWRAMLTMASLLNPLRYGFFSLELLSHKILRWLVPLFLVALLLVNALLLGDGIFYTLAFAAQVAFYLLALTGYFARRSASLPALLSIPYYFCLVNVASARGIFEAFRGKTYTTWTTVRMPET